MCKTMRFLFAALIFIISAAPAMNLWPVLAATAAGIDRDFDSALKKLYAFSPTAKELSKVAKGILVFPDVIKGGFMVGGHYGSGALRLGGKMIGYYNTVEAS